MKKKTETWIMLAENDFKLAFDIFKTPRSYYAPYFCHQAVEKYLKAYITEFTKEDPIYTHNFKLLIKQSTLVLPEDIEEKILKLAPHYIATRYPEDISELFKSYNKKEITRIIEDTKEIIKWLKTNFK